MSDETGSPRPFRWQALFHRASEPLFVLDRRRRLLFVNHAWEQLTGMTGERARGLLCRRPQPVGPDDSQDDLLAHVLTPPPEALQGNVARSRRLFIARPRSNAPTFSPPVWWDLEFFPMRQGGPHQGYLILGKIRPHPPAALPQAPPLSERLEGIRLQAMQRYTFDLLSGRGSAIRRLVQQARLASSVSVPVLLLGEPGSGKRTLARVIHTQSSVSEKSFISLNCRKLPPSFLADVLLAERTSPLWRSAGAIYLAEPAQLPRDLQLRLCDALASTETRNGPRFLAGISGCCQSLIQQGKLLEDLYTRLSTLTLEIPPLRERREDLPTLLESLLGPVRFQPEAWEALLAHRWPGNLRQLRQVMTAVKERAGAGEILLDHLPMTLRESRLVSQHAGSTSAPLNLEEVMQQVERRLIDLALQRARGNRTRAAELLGIHRSRLLRRLEALGEDPSENLQDD